MHVLITVVGQRTEHWTDMFAALVARPGMAVTVLAADVSTGTVAELARLSERFPWLRHHVVPHLMGANRTGHTASLVFRPATMRRLPVERPDVVHVIGEAAFLTTAQAIRLRRRWPDVPITLYAARNVVTRFPRPFPRLERTAHRAVDHAFPVTDAALSVLRAKGYEGPATVVPLGVDTALFTPAPVAPPSGRFTAGFVGRLEERKGVAVLLAAAERVDCDVLLVGAGSRSDLVDEAARRRPGRVLRQGPTGPADRPACLSRMDALVLPSVERERFGRVLVEAMACGVPVVGSEVGEIPHVIGGTGLTFPAGDSAALAERLDLLRRRPDLARRLSAGGLHRAVTEFSWDRIAETMCAVWSTLAVANTAVPARLS
ncbi:glycosyl transferase family 1 [Virgisporangium aliadipatigenens]|uniref:Glycosyl transferase family 1 n=1 Tax=Virgisporangium aliadipatigenens TaxID=741659 RepID=A0A8J4DSC8_9ACTN|nr:glycosyltransferase family 4 protein [Virgisporangium aliadipatigenens]GIJ49090.1 glycosyl transferase family 1 [Virgisporangium aliadipatigenens]